AAQGDPRAVLGLAGVALRSGVSSAIAPLWLVKDSATAPVMIEFYRLLQQEQTNKAEALRQAQLALLQNRLLPDDYSHPAYWAPYVLVGNWL
ncbi:MAG: CHAT domain-containing protein, partial [Planktothrix sp.]